MFSTGLNLMRFASSHSLPQDPTLYFLYHLSATLALLMAAIASAGSFGVQLFFLLSAFLITSLLLREKAATGDIHLRAFYLRRVLRIWPLYFFALALAAFWPLRNVRIPRSYLAAYLLLCGNWMTVFFDAPKTFMSNPLERVD
jgi:peptidoglycan/LPS O-acetylase OafA/YrhL